MSPIESVVRTFVIVEYLAAQDDWVGVRKLARDLHLGPATASRFLSSLKELGYVQQHATDARYRLTLRWAWLAARVLDRVQVRGIARPYLVRLADQTKETAHFAILDDDQVTYLDKADSGQLVQFRSRVGTRERVSSTALGRAMLAFLPEDEARALIARAQAEQATRPVPDPALVQQELAFIRQLGYAVDDEENEPGIRSIAAPVFNYAGRVAGAIEICGWAATVRRDRIPQLAAELLQVTDALSRELGAVRVRDDSAAPEVAPLATRRPSARKIIVALDTEIDTLEVSAFKSDAAYVLDSNTQECALDYGLVPGPQGSWRSSGTYEGKLAESWDLSADGLELTLHVRPGVTFHNGLPVDAEACKQSYDHHILYGGAHSRSIMDMALAAMDGGADVRQVEVVDRYTLRLHLEQPSPLLRELLATTLVPVVRFGMAPARNPGQGPQDGIHWMAVTTGTGPYRLGHVQPGVQWELEPNDEYWNREAVRNGGIVVKVVPSADARLELLKRGELDVIWGIPFRELSALERDARFRVIAYPSRSQNFMAINNAMPPFDNVDVRRAILHVLPYRELVEGANFGYAVPLRSPFPASMPTADPSLWPYGQGCNFEESRRPLAAGGYPRGFDTVLLVHEGRQADLDSAVLIQQALAEVGIRVRLRSEPSGRFFDLLVNRRAPLILHYFHAYVNDPFYCAYFILRSSGGSNFWNYANPAVDELIRQGLRAVDPALRASISRRLQKAVLDDAVYASLYSQHLVFVTSAQVSGFIAHADGHPRFWGMSKG